MIVTGRTGPAMLAATALASLLRPAEGQTMRLFSTSRPVGAERALHVTLDYSGGSVTVSSATGGELYHMAIRYDAGRYLPLQDYDSRTGVLHIGVEPAGGTGMYAATGPRPQQTAAFTFSPDVPLSLDARLGASEATLDLGATTLTALVVRGTATHAVVDFSRPTRGACVSATYTVGAGQITVHRLAQAGCATVRVGGGAGGVSLDFDGTWRRDIALVVDLAMGSLTLRIPRGTGVQLSADQFLSLMDTEGLVRSGNSWTTPGFGSAPHKLTVDLKTSMVGVDLKWIDP